MKMHITDYEKLYEIELCCITQLCGRNIQLKNYVYESIRRYYGGYKYSEQQITFLSMRLIQGGKNTK